MSCFGRAFGEAAQHVEDSSASLCTAAEECFGGCKATELACNDEAKAVRPACSLSAQWGQARPHALHPRIHLSAAGLLSPAIRDCAGPPAGVAAASQACTAELHVPCTQAADAPVRTWQVWRQVSDDAESLR